jgi:hypothetical protein
MKTIKTILAIIGFFVTLLWMAGNLGIGNFALIYTAKEINCREY